MKSELFGKFTFTGRVYVEIGGIIAAESKEAVVLRVKLFSLRQDINRKCGDPPRSNVFLQLPLGT